MPIFELKQIQNPRDYLHETVYYDIEKPLLLALARQFEIEELERLWQQLDRFNRHEVLEQAVFQTPDGDLIVPTHIADKNFRRMETATATKWRHDLAVLCNTPAINGFTPHNPSGRVRIAVPGVRLGMEIGGILDFFNDVGLAVDIEAVDRRAAAAELPLLNLEKRTAMLGSTVSFYSDTDANVFFKDKVYDIVILRNPGSAAEIEYLEWIQLIQTMAATRPNIVILSTYEYDIRDSAVLKNARAKNADSIKESRLFDAWLRQVGFFPRRSVQNSWLRYPYSPYMIVPDGRLSFTWPSDCHLALYTPAA